MHPTSSPLLSVSANINAGHGLLGTWSPSIVYASSSFMLMIVPNLAGTPQAITVRLSARYDLVGYGQEERGRVGEVL